MMPHRISTLLLLLLIPLRLLAQTSIQEKVAQLPAREGFFTLYPDTARGKLWMEINRLNTDFLYVTSLPTGLGSNDIGLDRGLMGEERVVRFVRQGNRVLLMEPNLRYRASSSNPAEVRAVKEAFAPSVLYGFTVVAEEEDRILVDATDFVIRDAMGVARRVRTAGQGHFKLDKSRSALYFPNIKSFPKNTEMEALLTFTGEDPGPFVRQVSADPYAFTLRIRHSFVELPPPGYQPRVFDPRAGFFPFTFVDMAVPVGADLTQRFIVRHRLIKKHPDAPVSEPVEPIVYYLDPGTPEPVRSALLEGARWWNEAFEAAGFRHAFRVEMLPDSADPMDVRYNVIQWVHRATRGWSYGRSVIDPRTGEIIKGHVTLGSLRVRQDYLIAEGLLAPYDSAHAAGYPPEEDPMLRMALARIRQLAAHEVGHTLGLAHNFAASIYGRASVMDYPAPYVRVRQDGSLSLDSAYAVGIGAWDKVAIRYGYTQFPEGVDEKEALENILKEAREEGLLFITDADARPPGGAHPLAHLWDNGSDPVAALDREMQVRAVALQHFGVQNIRKGMPLATLEERLVPIYLWHRYQLEATSKLVGGVFYTYALRGDGQPTPWPVAPERQRMALQALLRTLQPEALRLPEAARRLIPPRPPGYPMHRELFGRYTGVTFDDHTSPEIVATLVLELLTHPQRLARLINQHALDPRLPDVREVLGRINAAIWEASVPADPYDADNQRIVQAVWTDVLMARAQEQRMPPDAASAVEDVLRQIRDYLKEHPGRDARTRQHRARIREQVSRYLERPFAAAAPVGRIAAPPGSPIGEGKAALARMEIRRAQLRHVMQLLSPACSLDDTGEKPYLPSTIFGE